MKNVYHFVCVFFFCGDAWGKEGGEDWLILISGFYVFEYGLLGMNFFKMSKLCCFAIFDDFWHFAYSEDMMYDRDLSTGYNILYYHVGIHLCPIY